MYKNHTTALRALEMPPLVPYGTTFPPQFGGAAKGKRLNGQARRLTSPHLEVLCRTSTGDYKAPRSHVLISRSTLSTGCSAPACGGSPAQPERGASAASQSAEWFSCHITQKSKSRNVLASPLGEEGHEVAKGVQANWIHRGEKRPANPVRRHPAKSVWTRVRMIMILDVDVTAERRHYNTHRPAGDTTTLGPKGRQTYEPSGRQAGQS